MQDFAYGRAGSVSAAVQTASTTTTVAFIAGGTSLLDLMKEGVESPGTLIDINGLPLNTIAPHGQGLRIGALVSNTAVANHPLVKAHYRVLSEALLAGASPQLRNMASVGGNLLQRTRCPYFRDTGFHACNKRAPGTGCGAREGKHRMHAVLGTSAACIATHPSDMCVALTMLDAVVQVQGPKSSRAIPFSQFHLPPGAHPEHENALLPGEIILAVDLPAMPEARTSHYLKVRDRASYEFALASAGVALHLEGGVIRRAHLALGGVGTVPWRARLAEAALVGQKAGKAAFVLAAQAELAVAQPLRENAFKVELAQRTLVRALETVAEGVHA